MKTKQKEKIDSLASISVNKNLFKIKINKKVDKDTIGLIKKGIIMDLKLFLKYNTKK